MSYFLKVQNIKEYLDHVILGAQEKEEIKVKLGQRKSVHLYIAFCTKKVDERYLD